MQIRTKLDVQYEMRRLGLTQETLAGDLGLTREAISLVMRGKNRTPRIRTHLASKLGVPLGRLARALEWPDAPARKQPQKVA